MKVIVPLPTPESWGRRRGKYLFQRIKRDPSTSEGVVTAFRDGQVTLRSKRRADGFTNAELEIGYQGIRVGDLVIHGMDGFAGAIGVSDSDGKASPVVHAYLSLDGNDPRYYAYLLRDLAKNGFITSLAKGIRERSTAFDSEMFKCLDLPMPTVAEQMAIADYLDRETARIDALIEKKLQILALIGDRTEILLAKYLDELIERYGEVPLKTVAKLSVSNVDKKSYDGQIPVQLCNYTDVYYQRKISKEIVFMDATADFAQIQKLSLNKGDVLITKDSETADDIAVPALVVEDLPGVVLGYHLALLRPFGILGDFLYWVVLSRRCRDAFSLAASGVTRFGLRQDAIARVHVPMAPLDEQMTMIRFFENNITSGDMVVESIRRQVALLKERRQALITAAVTGDLEIAEVAA